MNSMRKLFSSCMVALVLAVFALPGNAAPEKIFSVAIAPTVVSDGSSVTLTATIKNETKGISSINSLTLNAPAGVTLASTPAPTNSWGGEVAVNATSVSITNMPPLRSSDPALVLTFTANFSGAAGCAPLTWNASAWTGSPLSGDPFRLLSPKETPTTRTTTVITNLALSFQAQPLNAVKSAPIPPPVSVQVTSSCGPATSFNGSVTLTAPGCTAGTCLTGNTATASGGVATFPALTIATPGTYTLTATAPTLGLTSAPSQSFTVFDGTLACKPGLPFTFSSLPLGVTNINQPGYAAGERGEFNKDGSNCIVVGYTFTNNILTSNSVQLEWNTVSQPGAAFQYTVTWKPEYVDPVTGLPKRTTKVAWFVDGVLMDPPVVGRTCLSPNLPAPYGTLTGPIVAATPTIVVTSPTATLPAVPFPITVGTERMTVTAVSVSGTDWSVTRGVGGTTAALHAFGAIVTSNPLPLDRAGNQMQMCIADEGWSVVAPGGPNSDCPTPPPDAPTPPRACVLYSTTVLDIGDGFMIRDE